MNTLTFEEVSELLCIEEEKLVWKTSRGRASVGKVAGGLDRQGYRCIGLQGNNILAHRIVWLLVTGAWPSGHLDHVNGDRSDNRMENLRLATRSQNMANTGAHANNRHGAKGITPLPSGKWQAQIQVNGVKRYLGAFQSKLDASAAYAKASKEAFGEFANTGAA